MLEGFIPPYESTVSQKLWDAGAGMLGKLNLDQFAMGSSNETSWFGNDISPWRRNDGGANLKDRAALAPGGSSGGSSTAIAARLRSEEPTSEVQSLMRISYAVFCLNKQIYE